MGQNVTLLLYSAMKTHIHKLAEAYTAEEIAKYLKLHPYTIRRLAREKKLPAFRAGGQWRFRRDEIDKWSKSYDISNHKSKTKKTK